MKRSFLSILAGVAVISVLELAGDMVTERVAPAASMPAAFTADPTVLR